MQQKGFFAAGALHCELRARACASRSREPAVRGRVDCVVTGPYVYWTVPVRIYWSGHPALLNGRLGREDAQAA